MSVSPRVLVGAVPRVVVSDTLARSTLPVLWTVTVYVKVPGVVIDVGSTDALTTTRGSSTFSVRIAVLARVWPESAVAVLTIWRAVRSAAVTV